MRRLLVRRMNRMPTLFEHLQRYMPMHKQALQYPCIVDARGVGVSGRVPSLLLLGRPLLYIARPKLWSWYTDPSYEEPLRDWEHIVPVAANLSNLEKSAQGGCLMSLKKRRPSRIAPPPTRDDTLPETCCCGNFHHSSSACGSETTVLKHRSSSR